MLERNKIFLTSPNLQHKEGEVLDLKDKVQKREDATTTVIIYLLNQLIVKLRSFQFHAQNQD